MSIFRSCNRHSVRCSSSRGAACPRRRSFRSSRTRCDRSDRDLPLIGVKTMEERAADATWRTRALTWLLSLFGALALLLAAIGVFGVISQAVQQRTPEIGLRIALGATPRDIIRLVVGRAVGLSIAGIVAGFALRRRLTTVLRAFLFEVEPDDPATFWTGAATGPGRGAVGVLSCPRGGRRVVESAGDDAGGVDVPCRC